MTSSLESLDDGKSTPIKSAEDKESRQQQSGYPGNTRTSRSSAGKANRLNQTSGDDEAHSSDSIESNPNLPSRLFAIDRLPDGARLNIHSKPEYLGVLVEVLKGSEAWDKIRESQFGKLFDFPVGRCSHSAKLIHGMLTRQLVTRKKHELWFVFGGFPLRFSLREFHITTGLRCGPLPSDIEVAEHHDPSYLCVWNRLFGSTKIVMVQDVLDMLRNDVKAEPENRLSQWKKLSLALIVLVDGVVVCSNSLSGRVSGEYVEMLHDIDFFLSYPWGRLAFTQTISRFGPVLGKQEPFEELKRRLAQQTSCCYGFPLAFQLQVLNLIPSIPRKLKDPLDLRNFIQRSSESVASPSLLRVTDVNEAEKDPNLSVGYSLFSHPIEDETELAWPDEEIDAKVETILSKLSQGHTFTPGEWPVSDIDQLKKPRPRSSGQESSQTGRFVDVDFVDISEDERPPKKVKIQHHPLTRKPCTRSSTKANEPPKPPTKRRQHAPRHSKKGPSASTAPPEPNIQSPLDEFVSYTQLAELKSWITAQLDGQRQKIVAELKDLLGLVGVHSSSNPATAPTHPGHTFGTRDADPGLTKGTNPPPHDAAFPNPLGTESPPQSPQKMSDVGGSSTIEKTAPAVTTVDLDDRWGLYGIARDISCKGFGVSDQVIGPDDGESIDHNLYGPEGVCRSPGSAFVYAAPDCNTDGPNTQMNPDAPTTLNSPVLHSEVGAEYHPECHDPEDVNDLMDAVVQDSMDSRPVTPVQVSDGVVGAPDHPEGHDHVNLNDLMDAVVQDTNDASQLTPDQPLNESDDFGSSEFVPKYRNLSAIVAVGPAYFVHETTKPWLPLPSKRIRRPSRLVDDEDFVGDPRVRALFNSRKKKPQYSPFPQVDESEFQKWKALMEENKDQYYTVCTGHKLSNGHFLDIATKEVWLTTEHIQVITSMLMRRRATAFATQRVAFLDPWFVDLLVTNHEDFIKSDDQANFNWGPTIKAYVEGRSTGKLMKSGFLKDVDVLYVPMSWGTTRWVGLVINLKLRSIEILDPFMKPFAEEVVSFEMRHVIECLPWVLKRFTNPEIGGNLATTPFTWVRTRGLYDNTGDADCGPVSVKFLEMHASGLGFSDMAPLSHDDVVLIRKSYAIDTYVSFVEGEDL